MRIASVSALLAPLLLPASALAQSPAQGIAQAAEVPGDAALAPPPVNLAVFRPYRVYTGSIQTSALLHADAVCPGETPVCPFGGGGGIVVSIGRRYRREREWVVDYEVSVRNARNLFFSATLQQIRVEHRWTLYSQRTNFEPFAGVGGGVAVYGERFGVTTLGPSVSGVVGGNYYLSPFVVLTASLRLEALRFLIPFDTGDGVLRGVGGVATLFSTALLGVSFLSS